jgi:tetratricopeptide (TPR) repeat protein
MIPVPVAEEEASVAVPEEPQDEGSQETPDWLREGDLDSEDAVKWLEQIAAKYDPNFKSEEAPAEPTPAAELAAVQPEEEKEEEEISWLREPLEGSVAESKPAEAEEEEEALPAWLSMEEAPEEAAPAAPAAPAGVDDALAWLDRKVEEQGVSPTGIVFEQLTPDHPPMAALPPSLDAEAVPASEEEMPEWLRGEEVQAEIEKALERPTAEGEMAELPDLEVADEELAWLDETLKAEAGIAGDLEDLLAEAEKEEEEMPSWLVSEKEEEPSPAQAMAAVPELKEEEAEALPAWLREMEAEEKEEEAAPAPTPALVTEAAAEEEEEELPAWLREEEKPVPAMEAKEEEEEELPAWLREEEAPAPVVPPPPPPAPEPIREPAPGEPLPAWLQAPVAEPVDKGLDDFLKAAVPATTTAPSAAPPPAAPPAPPPPPATGPLAPPPAVPAAPMGAPSGEGLPAARQQMAAGQVAAALGAYEALVTGGQSLDDVIFDLSDYVKKGRGVDPRAYRIIGDAMMAQGKLQDALEMYRRALDQF